MSMCPGFPGISLGWSCREPWVEGSLRGLQSRRLGTCPWEDNSDLGFLGFRRERVSISDQSQGFPPEGVKGMLSMESLPPPKHPHTQPHRVGSSGRRTSRSWCFVTVVIV